MHDLAVIIPSLDDGAWLRECLPSVVDAATGLTLDLVVVDIDSSDDTAAVAREHGARVVATRNHGFAHANNAGVLTCDARWILFLNPDTEVVTGTFAELVALLERRPRTGIAGCRQITGGGRLYPTMRRDTTARRMLAEAVGSERLAPALGHRVLDLDLYERERVCDWTIGSFMLCRREALESAGCMDERFFFFSEEEDLCRRVRAAGWEVRHLPQMTIVHHVGKRGVQPRFEAQRAFARRQFARKHLTRAGRAGALTGALLFDGLRALPLPLQRSDKRGRAAARAALRITLGRARAPFREPPATALPAGAVLTAAADRAPATARAR